MSDPAHGGKRAGAGRPALFNSGACKMVSLRLDPETIEKIEQAAKAWQCSKADVIRILARSLTSAAIARPGRP